MASATVSPMASMTVPGGNTPGRKCSGLFFYIHSTVVRGRAGLAVDVRGAVFHGDDEKTKIKKRVIYRR
jgi:hypothetical protein